MRHVFALSLLFLLFSCHSHAPAKPVKTAKDIRVAILPLNDANKTIIPLVQQELQAFYHCHVYILPAQQIPIQYLNTEKGERYSADSLLHFLAQYKADSITNVIGLTGKDIFTTVKENDGSIKQPAYKYKVWGIFGYGAQPGSTCILSDFRLQHKDSAIYFHRIRSVAIHELGHNLGLPHCQTPHCIMEAGKEKVSTVDEGWNDLCEECKKKLKQ